MLLKLDCEGSEYPIVSHLLEHERLNKVDVVIAEWHEQGPNPLVEMFKKAGFTIFFPHPYSREMPIMYAVNGRAKVGSDL